MLVITTLSKFDNKVWGYHFPVSDEIVDKLSQATHRRIIVTVDDNITYHAAFMSSKTGWFVLINDERKRRAKLELGQEVTLMIEKDESEYGMEMPEELRELLNQDIEGGEYFHQLTPGKQRNLIYIVSKVKNTDSRLNKALAIVDHLKTSQGKLDFKVLNQVIKEYNNR